MTRRAQTGSGSRCGSRGGTRDAVPCPASGTPGVAVPWLTVAALATGPVPARQEYRLCSAEDCPVVYFGADGVTLTTHQVARAPGFKTGGDGLLCYCFLFRREEFVGELRDRGASSILAAIETGVAAGRCACRVRNPAGRCCLPEVRRVVAETVEDGEERAGEGRLDAERE
jgi:hypothetical protein